MQDFLTTLLQCSVSMSLVTLVYAAILPLLSKRYAAKWRYMVWLVIAVGWIFPFRPRIDLPFLPVQMTGIPVTTVQPIINAMPPIADTGDIVNVSAKIPLWWIIAAIWTLGVVSVVLYHALRHGRFMKMVRRWSEPVTGSKSLEILGSLKSEMGIKAQVGLSVCQSITSPMLVGFFRPVILLPPIKIADDELSLVLKHELIHFKRHDLWYKALILVATAIHWFNPVVYFMAKATAVQCEISCDELVLQGADFERRKQYGETIIGVVKSGAKLRTALSTNFYGGKKGMKNRIFSIMDTKRKKAGVAILCLALVGIIMTGAMLTATANDGQNVPITSHNGNDDEAMENLTTDFSLYKEYGLVYDEATNKLNYQGKLVRYFEDFYTLEDGNQVGIDFFDKNGTVDVHAVRDLTPVKNYDGSVDPRGKLIGVEVYTQAQFDARDIATLKNPQQASPTTGEIASANDLAKEYAVYEKYGLSYDKNADCFFYEGKLVRYFEDILSVNSDGEVTSLRKTITANGTIDVHAVRDSSGTLTGVQAYSKEEFDARTKNWQENDNSQGKNTAQNTK